MRSFVVASCTLAAASIAACSSSTPGTSLSSSSQHTTESALSLKHAEPIKMVAQSTKPFTTFETLQVRPLALSHDGQLLFALNTPDNRLEIFHPRRDGLDKINVRPARQIGGRRARVAMLQPKARERLQGLDDVMRIVSR